MKYYKGDFAGHLSMEQQYHPCGSFSNFPGQAKEK